MRIAASFVLCHVRDATFRGSRDLLPFMLDPKAKPFANTRCYLLYLFKNEHGIQGPCLHFPEDWIKCVTVYCCQRRERATLFMRQIVICCSPIHLHFFFFKTSLNGFLLIHMFPWATNPHLVVSFYPLGLPP